MKIIKKNILDFLKEDYFIDVPIYSKKFIINEKKIIEIYDWIFNLENEHLCGALLYKEFQYNQYTFKELISFEQEIIIINIFLKALYDTLESTMREKLIDIFYINSNIKLIFNNEDKIYYEALLENKEEKLNDLYKCYKYYKKKLKRKKGSEIDVEERLKNLFVLSIGIEAQDRGKDLLETITVVNEDSKVEFLKKYIFIDLDIEKRNKLYYRFWKVVEENVENKYFDYFLEIFYDLSLKRWSKKSAFLEDTKELFGDIRSLEDRMETLVDIAYGYSKMNLEMVNLKRSILKDSNSKIEILLVKLFSEYNKQIIKKEEINNILIYLEQYKEFLNNRLIMEFIQEIDRNNYYDFIVKLIEEYRKDKNHNANINILINKNKKIKHVFWGNKIFEVKNLTEAYKVIILNAYKYNKEEFNALLKNNKMESKSFFVVNKEKLHGQYFEIDNTSMFINTKINSQRKIEFIQKLIKILNLEKLNIKIE